VAGKIFAWHPRRYVYLIFKCTNVPLHICSCPGRVSLAYLVLFFRSDVRFLIISLFFLFLFLITFRVAPVIAVRVYEECFVLPTPVLVARNMLICVKSSHWRCERTSMSSTQTDEYVVFPFLHQKLVTKGE